MAPGQKRGRSKPPTADVPVTEYEKERDQRMMRNNQVLQRLGVTELASFLNSFSNEKSKRVAREDSDSSYERADDAEDNEHGVVDKVSETSTVIKTTGGKRGSKRALAGSVQQDAPATARVTRRRMREQSALNDTCTDVEDVAAVAAPAAPAPAQDDGMEEMDHEGEPNDMINQRTRGRSMGKNLDKMCRGLNSKIPVVIVEGKRRPEAPMQAAKLASEAGIILRQHMPILTHWKLYKKDKSILPSYMGKVSAKFSMDTKDKAVESACSDLLKGGQRQMRHTLKKKWFDDVPANKVRTTSPLDAMTDIQWKALVEMWSSPKHMERCVKAKLSREKVKFHHNTGSRCYIAQTHVMKDKYKAAPPTAIDLFRDLHCSSKMGLSEPVREAIEQMEAIVAEPTEEGQAAKTPIEAVEQVLPSSKFLVNAGLRTEARKKTNATAARVQELEEEVQAERHDAATLRCQVDYQHNQLDCLTSAKEKLEQEVEILKKQGVETNALLRRLLNLSRE